MTDANEKNARVDKKYIPLVWYDREKNTLNVQYSREQLLRIGHNLLRPLNAAVTYEDMKRLPTYDELDDSIMSVGERALPVKTNRLIVKLSRAPLKLCSEKQKDFLRRNGWDSDKEYRVQLSLTNEDRKKLNLKAYLEDIAQQHMEKEWKFRFMRNTSILPEQQEYIKRNQVPVTRQRKWNVVSIDAAEKAINKFRAQVKARGEEREL